MGGRKLTFKAAFASGLLALGLAGIPLRPAYGASTTDAGSLQKAIKAAEAGDCKTSLRLLGPASGFPATMPDKARAVIAEMATACAIQTSQPTLAYTYAMDGTRLPEASDQLWRMRLAIELDGKRHDAAVATIAALTQGRGAALNSIPVRWMYQLDNEMRDGGDVAGRRRLLAMLVDPSYQPDEPVPVADVFRQRYAELLYDAGEKEAALRFAGQIDTPALVLGLSVDPRFRTVVPANYDARAAMTAYLARLRDVASYHPESLDVVIEIAAAERELGNPDRALATLQAADPTAPGARAYADKDEKLNWWWDAVARSHEAAGHYETAVAALRKGMDLGEDGQPNVSQTINLAEAQLRFGHPDDALRTLAIFDRQKMAASPYGEMEMRFARGCAAKLAGKMDAAGDVAYARAHAKDHPQALGDLLLCVGDLDGAAAAFIDRLDDPSRRPDALTELSDYDAPASVLPADPVYSRVPALKARKDVSEAIGRAGGTRSFNIQRQDL